MAQLKAGFAKTDITPELGVRLGGYGIPERPAEEIHDHLFSSALVLESGETRAAIISLDWLCIMDETAREIKAAVAEVASVPADNIIVCAIHSHTAPNTMGIPGWGDVEQDYIDSVMPGIIESARLAAENLTPARMGAASVTSKVGVNRRTFLEDGSFCFDGNLEGSFDPNMTLIRLIAADDKPIATLVHYGAHCTAWGLGRIVSRDWAGVMIDRIEKQTGSPAMFINGTIGDTGPRTNTRTERGNYSAGVGDGLEAVLEVGYRATDDALKCYDTIKKFDENVKLQAAVADMTIPARSLPPKAEAEAKVAELESQKDAWGHGKCQYHYWSRVLDAHSKPAEDTVTIESRIITLGPVAILTLPGEPFSSISLRLRESSPYEFTLIVSNANGCVAYIPDRQARSLGGYEVDMETAVNTYLPVENADSLIVHQGAEKLRELFDSNSE